MNQLNFEIIICLPRFKALGIYKSIEKHKKQIISMTTPEAKYNKYNDSKVYKIQFDDKYFYIGSTVQNLSSRFSGHKRDFQKDSKKI